MLDSNHARQVELDHRQHVHYRTHWPTLQRMEQAAFVARQQLPHFFDFECKRVRNVLATLVPVFVHFLLAVLLADGGLVHQEIECQDRCTASAAMAIWDAVD